MIKELYCVYKILKWQKKTFPKTDYDKQTKKLVGEIKEWNEALDDFYNNYRPDPNLMYLANIEQADVVISAIGCLRFESFIELVNEKMMINRKRKWKNGQHIK